MLNQTITKRLILPVPPSVNHSHRNVSMYRRIKTEEAKQFIHDAGWLAKEWAKQTGWIMSMLPQQIIMRVWIYWPDHRKRDADNVIKILQDALSGVLYVDDRVVLPQIHGMEVDKGNPRIEVEIIQK